jgi:SAM-dependent methyltransferase/transposase
LKRGAASACPQRHPLGMSAARACQNPPVGSGLAQNHRLSGECRIKGYETLMNESVPDLKVLLADRGYDADAVRADIEERGAVAIIPTKRNRRVQIEIDGAIYALRNRSNAASIASKTPSRVATRYHKLAETFNAFVHLAAIPFGFATLSTESSKVLLPVGYRPNRGRDSKMRHKSIFNDIYTNNAWGHGSGFGTLEQNTREYRHYIQNFIRLNKVKSVLDIGCGDWQFSKLIDWSGVKYIGADVSDVVLSNTKKFAREGVEFMELDALIDPLPEAELILLKEVVIHWSNEEILNFLPKLKEFERALITNGFYADGIRSADTNADIVTGDFRPVDLAEHPFNLKGNYVFEYVIEGEPGRIFLWTRTSRP